MKKNKIIPLLILSISFIAPSYTVARGIKQYAEPESAPDFNLPDLNGVTHRLADYRGKVLIVNFWAVWCQPCIKEMPSLQNAREQLQPDGIEVVAINGGDSADKIRAFLKRRPLNLQILLDRQKEVMVSWKVIAMPTTYVLDPAGNILMRITGEYQLDDPQLLEQVRSID